MSVPVFWLWTWPQENCLVSLNLRKELMKFYDVSFFPAEGRHIVLSEWDAKMQPHLVLQDKLIFLKRKEA